MCNEPLKSRFFFSFIIYLYSFIHKNSGLDILLILPKICTIFGFKSSKLPSMKTTGSVSFLLNILHIVFRKIIHMLSIVSTLDFLSLVLNVHTLVLNVHILVLNVHCNIFTLYENVKLTHNLTYFPH